MKGRYCIIANATKITKVEKFQAIAKILNESGVELISVGSESFSPEEFCKHEIELIQSKAEKSKSKRVDNSEYFEKVEQALANGSLTPTELMVKVGVPNTQKIAAIVSNMSNVDRTVKGKKVFYSLVR